MTRILITGVVGGGKTTLSEQLGKQHECLVLHTDDLMGTYEWSSASQYIADKWLTLPGPWIIEGVAVPRALRKYQEQNPHEPPPCDRVIVLTETHKELNPRQEAMGRTVCEHMADLGHWLGTDRVDWRDVW